MFKKIITYLYTRYCATDIQRRSSEAVSRYRSMHDIEKAEIWDLELSTLMNLPVIVIPNEPRSAFIGIMCGLDQVNGPGRKSLPLVRNAVTGEVSLCPCTIFAFTELAFNSVCDMEFRHLHHLLYGYRFSFIQDNDHYKNTSTDVTFDREKVLEELRNSDIYNFKPILDKWRTT